ncbi:MAG: twin-arginine translocase subunit TatC [Crocinitomicaceae bacterium]
MEENKGMSFFQHLEELRWRLVRSSIVIVILAGAIWVFRTWIMEHLFLSMASNDFITFKLMCSYFVACVDPIHIEMISTEMAGQFSYALMMSIVGGLVVAFPYIFWELWSFVKPGLRQNEVKAVRGIVFYVSFLFFCGVLFGYFIVAPLCVQFFGDFQISKGIKNTFTIGSYMSTIITTVAYSGLIFLLPMVIYFFSKLGLITPAFLRKYRKHAIVFVLILSAIITPPDVLSQIIVSIPILMLYEIGILVSARVEKQRIKKELK